MGLPLAQAGGMDFVLGYKQDSRTRWSFRIFLELFFWNSLGKGDFIRYPKSPEFIRYLKSDTEKLENEFVGSLINVSSMKKAL